MAPRAAAAARLDRARATSIGSARPRAAVASAAAARPPRGRPFVTSAPRAAKTRGHPVRPDAPAAVVGGESRAVVRPVDGLLRARIEAGTSTRGIAAIESDARSAMSAPPAIAAPSRSHGDRPIAASARSSPRARAGASASHAPTAEQTGASGSVRPARPPTASPPSSLAAVTTATSARPSAAIIAPRANARESHSVHRASTGANVTPRRCPKARRPDSPERRKPSGKTPPRSVLE